MSRKLKLLDYELGVTLGTGMILLMVVIGCLGSFGRVRLAKQKKEGKYRAAKILKKAEIIKLK
jgi:protein kinase X